LWRTCATRDDDPGLRRSVWDPEASRERIGDWGGPERSGPPCVLPKGGPQGQTESGGTVLADIEEEEEEEEDLFVFNDTIEGPRAPAVKPGRVTQA